MKKIVLWAPTQKEVCDNMLKTLRQDLISTEMTICLLFTTPHVWGIKHLQDITDFWSHPILGKATEWQLTKLTLFQPPTQIITTVGGGFNNRMQNLLMLTVTLDGSKEIDSYATEVWDYGEIRGELPGCPLGGVALAEKGNNLGTEFSDTLILRSVK